MVLRVVYAHFARKEGNILLNERISKIIVASGLQQSEFAKEAGIETERLKNLALGRVQRITLDEARKIEQRFGYRVSWLMNGKGPQYLTKEEQVLLCGEKAPLPALASATKLIQTWGVEDASLREFVQGAVLAFGTRNSSAFEDVLRVGVQRMLKAPGNADSNDYVYVPRYDVQASAGNGAVVHDESVVDHLAFKRDWITKTLGLDPQRLALIDVSGDSMAGTIDDGDLILIDTRPTPIKSEGIYVINLDGALLVKRLRLRLSGLVEVVSDNKHYGTETISGEQLSQLQVLGRVVWQGRRI